MFITESRSHLGFLPLQHEKFEQQVGRSILDQRAGIHGVRVLEHLTAAGEEGKFLYDDSTVGDIIGSFLWPNTTRRLPAWRLGPWPVTTVERGSTSTSSASFGQAGTPPIFQEDRGSGGAKSELFLPIRSDRFDRDSRFRTRQFKKPKVGARVARDPGSSTSTLVDVEVDAWPKFPVGWHGIALAADEETVQNDLFMPADPRLVVVNSENADPEAGSLLVELNSDNEVDGRRMSRLHAAFRIVPGPAIFCGEPTTAKFGGSLDVGVLAWNTFASGGSDQLPSGLLIGPGDGNDNVLAALASSRGGPIDLGVDRDTHRIGTAGRFPINQAHIWGGAIYRFGPSGAFDAPLLHHGRADLGFDPLPQDLTKVEIENGGIIPVFLHYDGTLRHDTFCGRPAPGHHRWFAVIPDEESARPADPTETVNVDRGAPEKPPPPLPPDLGNQVVPGAPRRIPPPLPPPDTGLQDPGAPPSPIPPPLPPDGGLQEPGPPPRRIPPPLPPGGDDDDVDVDPGAPELPCPPEGDPPGDVDRGGEETGPTLEGPCTSGPINGPKLLPPGEAIREALFGPISQAPPPVFSDATGTNPNPGPGYGRGSLTPVQLQQLFSEGQELYPEDRQTLSETRVSQKVAFSGAPNADRRQETFLETVRARGLTNLFFRASYLGDDAPNFPQWTGRGPGGGSSVPSPKARRIRQELQPIVGRFEAWGNQNEQLMGFQYTDDPGASRYFRLGTSAGGIALLPPETSLDDIRRGTESGESGICILFADNVDVAIGSVPSLSDGSVRGGWIVRERQSTDDLSFMRGKSTAPVDADSVIRFDQNDNVHLDFGQGDADAASGVGVIAVRNAGTNPAGTPADGVVLFADAGEIFVLDGTGAITNLALGGPTGGNSVTVTEDYTVQTVDDLILVDASGTAGDITITLPENTTAAELDGMRLTVKKIDSTDSDVIVVGTGGDLIDDAASLTISNEDDAYKFASDGFNWWITSEPDGNRINPDATRTFTATTASAATTLTEADDVLAVDCSVGNVVVTLPSAATFTGKRFTIKKIDATTNRMTLRRSGSDLIDGRTEFNTRLVDTMFEAVSFGGTSWELTQDPFFASRETIRFSSASTTIVIVDNILHVSSSGGARVVTLPDAATVTGRTFTVKKTDSSSNPVTITPSLSQTIDSQTTVSIITQNRSVSFYASSGNWQLVGYQVPVPNIRTFTATTADSTETLGVHDETLLVDASAIAATITLSTAGRMAARRITVKKIDTGSNLVTVTCTSQTTAGDNLLDGDFSLTLAAEDDAFEFISDGTAWFLIAKPAKGRTRQFTATTAAGTDTMATSDDILLVDATAQAVVVTLPDVAAMLDRRVTVKKIDSSTNGIVVLTPGAELIDGSSSLVVLIQYDAYELASDGSNWHIVSEPAPVKSCIVVTTDTTFDTAVHDRVLVDASGGAVIITLPSTILDLDGTRFTVKKIDSSGNTVTIDSLLQLTSGANLLDGQFTQVLNTQDAFFEFTEDGVAWFITSSG